MRCPYGFDRTDEEIRAKGVSMNKALEVLKSPICDFDSENDMNLHKKAVVLFATRKQISEAIAEIEEAMKPKSCDGCKHDEEMYCLTDMNKECYMCSRNMADRYVPKES